MTSHKEERAALLSAWSERKITAGIFLITNLRNGKVLLGSSLNLHGPLNKHRFTLATGGHVNAALQADFRAQGEATFRFEIVDTVKPSEEPGFVVSDELALLEQIWLEKLNPFGERGYNEHTRIREP